MAVIGAYIINKNMKKINFERIELFADIAHTQCVVQNVKTDFSNVIYTMGHGIEAHALALKIYNSSGETEYNENEIRLIKKYSELCQPAFIDAINRLIESEDDNQ